ncbi:MAG: carbamoyl-phosphate synthase small subunit [Cytophagia bacterium]|nr:MAG: carbamoyl-phosphate synthase small subunit [Cytophagia bacterium]TAG44647.1 MAG: carbamoyl-phosphate synthase small subunit [Cytophagia bacterium]
MDKAFLVLADGMTLEGQAIGKKGTTTGELCFNTGMTGYQEIYSDPSYFGQIIVNTNTHIGNYGVLEQENESAKAQISGMVCTTFSSSYSRFTADNSLQNYLENNEIVAIANIDTRALVKHLRQKGAMNAIISSEILDIEVLKKQLHQTPTMLGMELSSQISTKTPYFYGNENAKLKVAVLDLGIKTNILRNFEKRNIFAKVFPAETSFEEMEKFNPDGYFISNGPGDPASMPYAIETVKKILKANKILFGICLGHQLLALANGISTYKMTNGHRGLNHPVKNIITNQCEITSQNHGFGVSEFDVAKSNIVEITHLNLNDNSIEGIRIKGKQAFSVQYHPESSPGPNDSVYLFDEFVALLNDKNRKVFG